MATIRIRECTDQDARALQEVGIETFRETFGDVNSPENMNAYLAKAFRLGQVEKELSERNSRFFLAYEDEKVAGYLKVNVGDAQSERMGDDSLEIERIYVRGKFQRRGLGKVLFRQALTIAKAEEKRHVWLGVWEKNGNAIAFYERMGFVRTGAHSFLLGEEEQIDWIMTLTLR